MVHDPVPTHRNPNRSLTMESIKSYDGEVKICEKCGRPVLPTGTWMMPIDGFCECIFYRQVAECRPRKNSVIGSTEHP